MMHEKINRNQLFTLIIFFELGSTFLVGLSLNAGKDAWIVLLLSLLGGLGLLMGYLKLYSYYPDLLFTQSVIKVLGKLIGYPIALLYCIYFFYIGARVLRDFGDLLAITILHGTPLFVTISLFTIIIGFGAYLGIEVLARTGEIFLPWALLMGGLFIFFVYIMGLPQLAHLQPMLDKGWENVWSNVFPSGITFPFGEIIAFSMLYPYVNEQKKLATTSLFGVLLSGLIITFMSVTIISVLGPNWAKSSAVPVLDTISMVNLQDFIQRLDPIVIILMVMAGFFKIALLFYVAFIGLNDLLSIPKNRKGSFVITLGIMMITIALVMSENYIEHTEVGLKIVPLYIHVPMQIVLPSILISIAFFQKKLTKN
ncbi:endospore germination permease [Pontibacillus yanchengensis]|uniref:Endospore germination permease n=2 Tax=Pontibacillus yanchengensis TaxID=462910 RepID=A0ACC7VCF6_9BACI|nr:endospore germination permease [Pontibacillus yanchengensis]MYL35311.1 endospore germination permease [Pontibacillus yanchengensis]MYL52340.1 endospore germination permease [Pontibacillus yanchengensis]